MIYIPVYMRLEAIGIMDMHLANSVSYRTTELGNNPGRSIA